MTPQPSTTGVPRIMLVVGGLVILTGALMAFIGAVTVGVTWDERVQVYMLQAFFDQGWHTAARIIDGVPDPKFYYGTFVYGPVGELLPHLVNVVLGREQLWGTVPLTAEAYAGRHIGVALWGLLGVAAAGTTVGVLTRSWRWAVLGAALLSSVPLWTGHSMFNIKDVPAATGYTVLTLGLVVLLDDWYFTRRWLRILGLVSITAGLVVVIGTRTALALPLIMTLPMVVFVAWLFALRRGRGPARELRASRRFVEGFLAYVASYLILLALYPKAFINPIEVGAKALLDSALYPVNEAQLTNGTWLVQPVSWTYQPLWFGAQLPLLVVAGLLGFVAWWVVRAIQSIARPQVAENAAPWVPQTTPVLVQLTMVPVGAIVGSSTLYNGTRQMLFVPPAAVVLATLALFLLVRWHRISGTRPLRVVTWAVVSLGLLAPMLAQLQLFPYGYTYVNAVAALKPVDGNWPTDYWRASGRELLRALPIEGRDSCGLEQLQKGTFFPCTDQPMFEPFLDERGTDAPDVTLAPNEYWFIRENSGVLDLPPGCRPFTTVERRLFWQTVTIGQIAICDDRIDTGKRNMADPSLPAS